MPLALILAKGGSMISVCGGGGGGGGVCVFIKLLWFDCCTPFPPSFYSAVWRTRCPCSWFVFLSGLSCTTYICIWLPFLPYAYCMWLRWFISLLLLGFPPPESLPGDDVLFCRLLPRPLPSSCFLPCLFVFFCFVLFSDRVRPRFVLV